MLKKSILLLVSLIVLMTILMVAPMQIFCAEREGSAETFLSRGKGKWVSSRDSSGSVILFIFERNEIYCGGETRDVLTKSCGRYQVYSDDNGYFLKLIEQSGKVMKMSFEIKNDYTILLNGRELRRYE